MYGGGRWAWALPVDGWTDSVCVRPQVFVAYTAGDVTAPDAVVFVLLHGAGHSAMAWAQVAAAVKSQHPVVAFDYRGHGRAPRASPRCSLRSPPLTDVRCLRAGDTKCKDERDLVRHARRPACRSVCPHVAVVCCSPPTGSSMTPLP